MREGFESSGCLQIADIPGKPPHFARGSHLAGGGNVLPRKEIKEVKIEG